MKKKLVILKLTYEEARELSYAAGGGYGDGDLYEANYKGQDAEQARRQNIFIRADRKLSRAMVKARP